MLGRKLQWFEKLYWENAGRGRQIHSRQGQQQVQRIWKGTLDKIEEREEKNREINLEMLKRKLLLRSWLVTFKILVSKSGDLRN